MTDREPLLPFREAAPGEWNRMVDETAKKWIERGCPPMSQGAIWNKPRFCTEVFIRAISMRLEGEK